VSGLTLIIPPPEKLTETRAFHVEQLRKQIETIQAERSHIRGKGPQHVCQLSTSLSYSPRECEAMQLGHLIQSIIEHQLDDNDTWRGSLRSISDKIRKINQMYLTVSYCSHPNCSWVPGLHTFVDQTLASVQGLKLSDFPSRSGLRSWSVQSRFVARWSYLSLFRFSGPSPSWEVLWSYHYLQLH